MSAEQTATSLALPDEAGTFRESKEFTGPGSVHQIFKMTQRWERDASGHLPCFSKSDPQEEQKKKRIN